MGMTDREKHIKNLSCIMDSMPDDACGDWRDSLAYAISSLKTDEAYQIMYEGGEVFTKADILTRFKELQKEIEEMDSREHECRFATQCCINRDVVMEIVQEKIDALEKNKI